MAAWPSQDPVLLIGKLSSPPSSLQPCLNNLTVRINHPDCLQTVGLQSIFAPHHSWGARQTPGVNDGVGQRESRAGTETEWDDLRFYKCSTFPHLPPYLTSYISYLAYLLSHLTPHISYLFSHLPHLISHLSLLTSHISYLFSHLSPPTSHI